MKAKRIGGHKLPIPSRAHSSDAGFDLSANTGFMLPAGNQRIVPTGWALAIPRGWVGLIRDRSGMACKHRVVVNAGVVDYGYNGEIQVALSNESDEHIWINDGDRIAQIVIVPICDGIFSEVDNLADTDRGDNGFGSTG